MTPAAARPHQQALDFWTAERDRALADGNDRAAGEARDHIAIHAAILGVNE